MSSVRSKYIYIAAPQAIRLPYTHPGTTPPHGRVFPFLLPETGAMSSYIKEILDKGFIRKSSYPASVGFLFVEKKNGLA